MHRLEVIEKMEMHPVLIAHVVNEAERGLASEEMLGVFTNMEQVLMRIQNAVQHPYHSIRKDSCIRVYTVYLNDTENVPLYHQYSIRWFEDTPTDLYKEYV